MRKSMTFVTLIALVVDCPPATIADASLASRQGLAVSLVKRAGSSTINTDAIYSTSISSTVELQSRDIPSVFSTEISCITLAASDIACDTAVLHSVITLARTNTTTIIGIKATSQRSQNQISALSTIFMNGLSTALIGDAPSIVIETTTTPSENSGSISTTSSNKTPHLMTITSTFTGVFSLPSTPSIETNTQMSTSSIVQTTPLSDLTTSSSLPISSNRAQERPASSSFLNTLSAASSTASRTDPEILPSIASLLLSINPSIVLPPKSTAPSLSNFSSFKSISTTAIMASTILITDVPQSDNYSKPTRFPGNLSHQIISTTNDDFITQVTGTSVESEMPSNAPITSTPYTTQITDTIETTGQWSNGQPLPTPSVGVIVNSAPMFRFQVSSYFWWLFAFGLFGSCLSSSDRVRIVSSASDQVTS